MHNQLSLPVCGVSFSVLLTLLSCGCQPARSQEVKNSQTPTPNSSICPFFGTELRFKVQANTQTTVQPVSPLNRTQTVLLSESNNPDSSKIKVSVLVVQEVFETRLKNLGIVNAQVLLFADNNQLVVLLPQGSNVQQVQRVLTKTAQLEFRQQRRGTDKQFAALMAAKKQDNAPKNNQAIAALFTRSNPPVTGKYITDAYITTTQSQNNWDISIQFDKQGSEIFTQLTKNLAGTGRSIGIFIDNELISAPVVSVDYVETGITGGTAVITGNFTAEQTNDLSVQLRSGVLPAFVELVSSHKINRHRC